MYFTILGEISVWIDGRPVDAGHVRQRCVLAVLLAEANRAVPVDELITRVWGDRRPLRTRRTLSSYLSRIRRVLECNTEVAIARRAGGYLLTVDPMRVDMHRFQTLCKRAQASVDDEAAPLFDQALDLWRGEAFAELDTPWFRLSRDYLLQQRYVAELDRADVALRLGRHAHLLAELFIRATEHPLDERVAGQLMLALYRSGRQAEAISWYLRLCSRLGEQLGVDPCPSLRGLYQRILVSDAEHDVIGSPA